jgi:immunity protein 52 of polymorphic toxin system
MNNSLVMGAYWQARRESLELCTDRLFKFMARLRDCDEVFANWYHRGGSRKEALKNRIDAKNRQELLALLTTGRNRRDTDKGIIEDLGFRAGMWNGAQPDRAASLDMRCGLFSKVAGLSNSVVLNFPRELGRLSDSEVVSRLLEAAAVSWDPDWAGIFSNEAMKSRDWEQKPFVDWMVYIPRGIGSVPRPSSLRHLENGGSLIVVQPITPVLGNPEDHKRIREIERVIRS